MITSLIILVILGRVAKYFGWEWRLIRWVKYKLNRIIRLKYPSIYFSGKTSVNLIPVPEKVTTQ